MQNRRDFIKQSCTLCLGVVGLSALTTQLAGCAPMPIYKGETVNGIITVPFTSFTETNKVVIVRNAQLDWDIVLVKVSDTEYEALQMKCTHQENPLTATQTGLFCSAHGSTFDLKGNVTKEPALRPLKKYITEIRDNSISINTKS
jgi:Rieske Fe-S protein